MMTRFDAKDGERHRGKIDKASTPVNTILDGSNNNFGGDIGRRTSTEALRNIKAMKILRTASPSFTMCLTKSLRASLLCVRANPLTTMSSMVALRTYLASIYQIYLAKAERRANMQIAGMVNFIDNVFVASGKNRAPRERNGDKRYRKTVDEEREVSEDDSQSISEESSSPSSSSSLLK